MEHHNLDPILTLGEISDLTRLPVSTIRHYRQRGLGPPLFKIGRRLYGHESDVLDWIAQRKENQQ